MVICTTILRGVVGSTIHGLHVEDGLEDRDEMGVCVEDLDACVGFDVFEHYIYRSAAEREQRHDARSRGGDLDLTIFSLRKYLRLALKGNPTVLNLLFVPPEACVVRNTHGAELQELAPLIVSREAGKAFLGYLQAQRQRLTGERGQKDVNRPELVAKYGFDTKYAMHMLRLGFQGVEIMETGRLSLPMREPERGWLRGVRLGESSLQDCLTRAGELEREIRDLLVSGPIRPEPDRAAVEKWMLRVYLGLWSDKT
jgi:predicted nucleotidyltransferase